MILGKVVGTVVATRKDERLEGFKLLVVQAVEPDGRAKDSYVIAVDTVDAGVGDLVLVISGSSARMASGCADSTRWWPRASLGFRRLRCISTRRYSVADSAAERISLRISSPTPCKSPTAKVSPSCAKTRPS